MKNLFLVMLAVLTMLSCQKQTTVEQAKETDLGYGAFKYGEVVHTLYAGKTIDVGTVTVGIDDNSDYIYVKFETIPGWYIEETHVFVGPEGALIPVNKPGNPKIGHFPYSTDHQIGDGTVVTYPTIPYTDGQAFVVATHASVYNDNGQQETAWGYNDADPSTNTFFSGKRWGWFQSFAYNGEEPPKTNLFYMMQYDDLDGLLSVYQYDFEDEDTGIDLISQESLNAGSEGILGASWDPVSNHFVFVSNSGTELWAIDFDVDELAYRLGYLVSEAQNGSFVGDTYYYVDIANNLRAITFDNDMSIVTDENVGLLNSAYDVADLTASPDGQSIYILVDNNTENEIVTYDISSETDSYFADLVAGNFQLAFDADGQLYAFELSILPSPSFTIHVFNEDTGEFQDSNDSGEVPNPGEGDIVPGPLV